MNNRIKHLIALGSLPIIAILAYWQVAFNSYILTHDFVNCWMPWRYYLSNCIQNGIFPYWNPYQQLGYPIHADLQGPIWYLESWFFSMLTQQNPMNLQYLFVGYIALAGIGMYALSHYLQGSKKIAWCIAVAYMLGGFFVSHSQHFYSIISAAWLPFIVLNFLRLVQLKQMKYGMYCSIFLFFTLTGGNHTFAFFTTYLLGTISIYYLYKAYQASLKSFLELLRYLCFTLILTIAQVLMLFVVFVQVQPFITRLNGLDFASSASNPFTWQAMISFFQPFATTVEWDFYNTDPSMSNHYFGIFILPFCLFILLKRKTALEIILALFALFCFIMSLGDATPLYHIMYNFLPGINLFRFVSYFAFMFTFCMLLLAGNTMKSFQMQQFSQDKKYKLTGIVFLGIITCIFFFAFTKSNLLTFVSHFFSHELFDRTTFGNRYDHIAFQSALQLILGISLLLVYLTKSRYFSYALMLVILIDSGLAVQLNIGNVCVGNTSPIILNNYLQTLPKDFPCPADEPLSHYNEERGQKSGLFRNTAIFHKWVSDSYHNSFVFSGKTFLYFEKTKFHQALLQNNLFYLSNALYPIGQIDKQLDASDLNQKVFMEEQTLNDLALSVHITDAHVDGVVKLKTVHPNYLQASVVCNELAVLHCIQSFYTGWKAFIDDEETTIYKSNGLNMSVLVPKGKHLITFKYKNTLALGAGIVSYTIFFIILIYVSIINWNHPVYRYLFLLFWLVTIFTLIKYFCF